MDWNLCLAELDAGRDCALVTLITRDGSAPRGPGAKMAVTLTATSGTVGGGALEGKAVEAGRNAIREHASRLLSFCLTEGEMDSVDMSCGGRVTLLAEYLPATEENRRHLRLLEAGRAGSEVSACLTALEIGPDGLAVARAAADRDGTLHGALPAWACPPQPLAPGQTYRLRSFGENRLLLTEAAAPPLHLYICGGGHVGRKTAELALLWGQRVTVVDDRDEFAGPERFPGAQVRVCPEYRDLFRDCRLGPGHCVVIVTRGHRYDQVVLEQALATDAGYIGMIGSKTKVRKTMEALSAGGWSQAQLARVHAPIGLNIGAETPAEIAVSIVAEIISAMGDRQAPAERPATLSVPVP